MNTTAAGPLPPVERGRSRLYAALTAAALGTGLWLLPAESEAAPRCTSKPVVCARLAAVAKARAQAAPVSVARPQAAAVARVEPRCTSKPAVCARMEALAARAPAPRPVMVSSNATPPCTSKPVVCARLRHRDKATPVTLASDEPR